MVSIRDASKPHPQPEKYPPPKEECRYTAAGEVPIEEWQIGDRLLGTNIGERALVGVMEWPGLRKFVDLLNAVLDFLWRRIWLCT